MRQSPYNLSGTAYPIPFFFLCASAPVGKQGILLFLQLSEWRDVHNKWQHCENLCLNA